MSLYTDAIDVCWLPVCDCKSIFLVAVLLIAAVLGVEQQSSFQHICLVISKVLVSMSVLGIPKQYL